MSKPAPPTALVVDPASGERERVADALEAFGYEVRFCPGPPEGGSCVGIREGRCPLSADASLVVLAMRTASTDRSLLDLYLAQGHAVIAIASEADPVHARTDANLVAVPPAPDGLTLANAIRACAPTGRG